MHNSGLICQKNISHLKHGRKSLSPNIAERNDGQGLLWSTSVLTPPMPHCHLGRETGVAILNWLNVSLVMEMERLTLSKYE